MMAGVDTVIQNNSRIMTNMLLCNQTYAYAVNFRTLEVHTFHADFFIYGIFILKFCLNQDTFYSELGS